MSIEEIRASNIAGATVVYVNSGGDWNNSIENEYILWDAAPDALTMAQNSKLKIHGRTVAIVDSDNDCRGFYYIGDSDGGRVRLEPYFCPSYRGHLPAAPRRPPGGSNAQYLTVDRLESYLTNLSKFLG